MVHGKATDCTWESDCQPETELSIGLGLPVTSPKLTATAP